MITPTVWKAWKRGEISDKDFGAILKIEGHAQAWQDFMDCRIGTSDLALIVVDSSREYANEWR